MFLKGEIMVVLRFLWLFLFVWIATSASKGSWKKLNTKGIKRLTVNGRQDIPSAPSNNPSGGEASVQDPTPYNNGKADEAKKEDDKNVDINVFLPKKKRFDEGISMPFRSANAFPVPVDGGNIVMPMINELSRALEREQMSQEMSHMSHSISQTMVDALLLAGRHDDHGHHVEDIFHHDDYDHHHDHHDDHHHELSLHDLEYAFDHFPHHDGIKEDQIVHALKSAFQSVVKEVREKDKKSDQTLVQAIPDTEAAPETEIVQAAPAAAPSPPAAPAVLEAPAQTPPPAIVAAPSPAPALPPAQPAAEIVAAAAAPPPPPPPAVVVPPPPPPPPPIVAAAPPPPPPVVAAAPPPPVVAAPPPPAPVAAAPPPPVAASPPAPIAAAPPPPIVAAPPPPVAAAPPPPVIAAPPPAPVVAAPPAPIAAAPPPPIAGAPPPPGASPSKASLPPAAPSAAQSSPTVQNPAEVAPTTKQSTTSSSTEGADVNSGASSSKPAPEPSPSASTGQSGGGDSAMKDFRADNKGYKILGEILAKAMVKAEKKLGEGIQGAVIENKRNKKIVQKHAGNDDSDDDNGQSLKSEETDKSHDEKGNFNEDYGPSESEQMPHRVALHEHNEDGEEDASSFGKHAETEGEENVGLDAEERNIEEEGAGGNSYDTNNFEKKKAKEGTQMKKKGKGVERHENEASSYRQMSHRINKKEKKHATLKADSIKSEDDIDNEKEGTYNDGSGRSINLRKSRKKPRKSYRIHRKKGQGL